ncbi:hypothetical protein LTR17_013348 [Elasticomyces elasticus]|nr:hypothetical protein LTR17_013348 [Elasticomyces elasticus]
MASRSSSNPRSSSRSKRSTTNLAGLRLAPLSTKFAEPTSDEVARKASHDETPRVTFATQHSSYIQGKSAPSTPGILSRSSSRRNLSGGLSRRGSLYDDAVEYQYGAVRLHSGDGERAEMGSGQIPKAKSEATLSTRQAGSGALRKKQYHGRSKTGTNTPRGVHYADDEDWLARTRAATHDIVQEAKGQSWLASRNSSATLTHLESDDDAIDDGYEEMAALSASQRRGGGMLSPTATRVKSPMWGSRYGSRSGSRRSSRRGSATGVRTPLAVPAGLDMTSYFAEDVVAEPVEPEYFHAEYDEEEGELARLSDQQSYGMGGIVDRLMQFRLFSVAEKEEITTDEEDPGNETGNESDARRAEAAKTRRNERVTAAPTKPAPDEEQGEGGWQDAAWLLSVASKAIF